MAKFGLYTLSHGPFQEFEGDYMLMDKEFVKIFSWTDQPGESMLIAAVRLDKGQTVKKM